MVDITSRSSVIRRGELKKCVELLGTEYTSLPYKIYVYRDREEVQAEMINNPDMDIKDYNYILNNVSYKPGVCLHEKKLIKLFPFNNHPIKSVNAKAAFHWERIS